MATRPRSRAAAQRATAKRVREYSRTGRYTPVTPKSIRATVFQSQVAYANSVIAGDNPMPAQGTPEAKQLARMASLARWNKAAPRFYAAFQQYFYHDEKRSEPDEADEEFEPDEEEE